MLYKNYIDNKNLVSIYSKNQKDFIYDWLEQLISESTGKEAAIVFVKRAKSRKDYLSELLRVINKYNLPINNNILLE